MNDKEALLTYRMTQAEETLVDAQKMLENNFSPRSVEKVVEVKNMEQAPDVLNSKICKKCGYEDFCYS